MKKDILKNVKKDLTISMHYTIKRSLVEKVRQDAKKYNLSESKVVTLILAEYYKDSE